MTRTDILEELNKLPADERLGIVESAPSACTVR
jgi:hypothetical protein